MTSSKREQAKHIFCQFKIAMKFLQEKDPQYLNSEKELRSRFMIFHIEKAKRDFEFWYWLKRKGIDEKIFKE